MDCLVRRLLNEDDALVRPARNDFRNVAMNLFDRDFTKLTPEEEAEWREHQRLEVVSEVGRFRISRSRFRQYPRAVRHYISLFPNHYLDIMELRDEAPLRAQVAAFRELLDSPGVGERDLLNYINTQKAYFIIGSLLKAHFSFGHHDTHLFPEFPLGVSYRADYLLVGKSSGGWQFVFVEFEAPSGQITLGSGEPGGAFRKGLSQVADWDAWLEAHYANVTEVFDRHRNPSEALPKEFRLLDKSRMHYVVIAGRRTDFTEKTYRTRRTRRDSELMLHYDNLLDAAEEVIGRNTY